MKFEVKEMAKIKSILFNIITKLEYIDYALVIILWIAGAVLTILNFPWITLGIFFLHLFETITIGIRTGHRAGEGLLYSAVMCMMFGFTWWVPVKVKNNLD